MAFQLQLSGVVLKNLFTSGLRPDVKDRALKHPDWFKCSTVEDRQAVALLASEQVMHVSANNASLGQSNVMQRAASSPPIVQVPRDPNAMDVDVNAADSRRVFPPLPNGVSFGSFIKFCHARTMCHKCLRAYDSTHKGPDGRSIPCPNPPPKTTQEIKSFMQHNQSRPNVVAAVSSSPHRFPAARVQRQQAHSVQVPNQQFSHALQHAPNVSSGFYQVPMMAPIYHQPPHMQPFQFGPPTQGVTPLHHPGLPVAMGMPPALGVTDPTQQSY
ncbi:uncharacterized protein MELLADRAFT_60920 [Melampsora larici-populina 98AG31]|uniref:Uncharacterized protein n=1 Tax=Melampsora larici-populina (strain 98AG31 / pathotype 3-4-7) TaxID=747676 RepID=F4RCX8_MELLP|nr:uncharacterized protein MELLADRAFT_60920 [Melampsora larici-populina 98AG31]EGG09912.1 hypothetical protein MELLADRAFT_60920 [Melampsora larici-populina 98AG31]